MSAWRSLVGNTTYDIDEEAKMIHKNPKRHFHVIVTIICHNNNNKKIASNMSVKTIWISKGHYSSC